MMSRSEISREGRGGKSKVAKVGMAFGGLLAVSTCVLALAGNGSSIETVNLMQEADLIQEQWPNNRFARKLKALTEEANKANKPEEPKLKASKRAQRRESNENLMKNATWGLDLKDRMEPHDDT